VSDAHKLGDADGPEPPYVWLEAPNVRLEAVKRARTLARLEGANANRPREGKRAQKQRYGLYEYRKKHARVLSQLMICRNASETARRLGISPTRVRKIMRRSGIRFVRALQWPSGKLMPF
jgi:hypothetical protein